MMMVAPLFPSRRRIGYERQSSSRAIDVILHRRRPAQPDRPDNFSVHLNGNPPTPRRHTRERGDTGQKAVTNIIQTDAASVNESDSGHFTTA
jgi:hypothetical protein